MYVHTHTHTHTHLHTYTHLHTTLSLTNVHTTHTLTHIYLHTLTHSLTHTQTVSAQVRPHRSPYCTTNPHHLLSSGHSCQEKRLSNEISLKRLTLSGHKPQISSEQHFSNKNGKGMIRVST